jgi:hypothetical protein
MPKSLHLRQNNPPEEHSDSLADFSLCGVASSYAAAHNAYARSAGTSFRGTSRSDANELSVRFASSANVKNSHIRTTG